MREPRRVRPPIKHSVTPATSPALHHIEVVTHHPTSHPSQSRKMGDVQIAVPTFHTRASKFFNNWAAKNEEAAPLGEVEHLLLIAGNSDEENPYRKTSALQTHLLGYEFPSTLMLFSLETRKVYFVVSGSKAKLLQPLADKPTGDSVAVEILTRSKDEAQNKALFQQIVDIIGTGNKVGVLPKDRMAGKFVNEWTALKFELKEVDVAGGVSALLAVKDRDEVECTRSATAMTELLLDYFQGQMADYIDSGKTITHEQLGEKIEGKLEDSKWWKQQMPDGARWKASFGDWCYSPIIQSGGVYDLKSSAQTDDKKLKPGVILCSLGIRYKSYCANVGRTFLIDPDKQQEDNYTFLSQLHKHALEQLKPGTLVKDVYAAILAKIEADRPELLPYFAKTAGFGIGLEFRDSAYAINAKCTRTVQENMIFSLTLGFNNIPHAKDSSKSYALSLVDTVKIGPSGGELLSKEFTSWDDVTFYLNDAEAEKPSRSTRTKEPAHTAVVKSKLRNENREVDAESTNRRKQHQKELAQRRQDDGLKKYEDGNAGLAGGGKQWRRFESYVRENQLPEAVASQKIMLDTRRQTVILPINGFAVPFHINTLKSVIKQDEGEYTVLRFMFTTPGAITGKKEDTPFEDNTATFIRGLTYRSTDSFRFTEMHKEITELKKNAVKRESERKEMADVVEQDKLTERKKPIKLTDIQVRPSFDGKRAIGDVEIHENGIRYVSSARSEHKIDILFNNIKHLLFQPCDNELVVILHVHLKNPILLGKKKAKDIQFFREASDASFDETGNKKRRKNYHDEDELQQEQDERKRRADLNKYFKAFADKMADASDGHLEVDIPFRELGFQGVPFRANVLLQPTTDTLIFLTEPPFLVLTLAEIEIAHLERVQYGLKNFDMVIIFSDFTRTPIHINTIPMNQLDNVKEWLDSVDVPFTEGPVNLNWAAIMKTVNDDPYDFFKEGGWSFLAESDHEDGGSDDESDEESEFSAGSDASEDDDDDSDSESEFDDDASDDDGSADGEDDEDSGMDWDEAEAELERKERSKKGSKGKQDSSDDDAPKKKGGKGRRLDAK